MSQAESAEGVPVGMSVMVAGKAPETPTLSAVEEGSFGQGCRHRLPH